MNSGAGLKGTYIRHNGSFSSPELINSMTGEIYTADFDGSGTDELIISNADGFKLFRWDIDAAIPGFVQVTGSSNHHIVLTGDFNGDGLTDMIAKQGNSHYVFLGKPDITAFFADGRLITDEVDFAQFRTGRFLGDGSDALIEISGNNTNKEVDLYKLEVMTNNSSLHEVCNISLGSMYQTLDIGDFNGDGKDDLLVTTKSAEDTINMRDVSIYYGTGSCFYSPKTVVVSNAGAWYSSFYQIADFNNDGLSDIVFFGEGEKKSNHTVGISYQVLLKHPDVKNITWETISGSVEIPFNELNGAGYVEWLDNNFSSSVVDIHGSGSNNLLITVAAWYST